MKTAYVNNLSQGEILVEVQVKVKKRIEAFFHEFTSEEELDQFKKENEDTKFHCCRVTNIREFWYLGAV